MAEDRGYNAVSNIKIKDRFQPLGTADAYNCDVKAIENVSAKQDNLEYLNGLIEVTD